jgi:hypothetical protein
MDEIPPAGEPSTSTDVDSDASASGAPPDEDHLRLEVTYGDASFSAEGGADMVLHAFAAFKETVPIQRGEGAAQSKVTAARVETPGERVETPVDKGKGSSSDLPLPVFIGNYKIKSNPQAALAIAVWAARVRDETELTLESFTTHWRSSARKMPANLSRDIQGAIHEGWLERIAPNRYRTTSYGERHLDEELSGEKK